MRQIEILPKCAYVPLDQVWLVNLAMCIFWHIIISQRAITSFLLTSNIYQLWSKFLQTLMNEQLNNIVDI